MCTCHWSSLLSEKIGHNEHIDLIWQGLTPVTFSSFTCAELGNASTMADPLSPQCIKIVQVLSSSLQRFDIFISLRY
jgi:hypothetical protein